MSQKVIFKSIKAALTEIKQIKTVGMWNNDFAKEAEGDSFKYPASFIEFKPKGFRDFSSTGIQDYDLVVTIHLGFEHYKTEPELIYDVKQEIHKKLQHIRLVDGSDELEYPISKFTRVDERQNFDHDNLMDIEIDYLVKVRDASGDKRKLVDTTDHTLTITPTIVTEITE